MAPLTAIRRAAEVDSSRVRALSGGVSGGCAAAIAFTVATGPLLQVGLVAVLT